MFELGQNKLILASASTARAKLLEQTGLSFEIHPANIDEAIIKSVFKAEGKQADPADIADILAETKAKLISNAYPDALVIGADQILAFQSKIYDKPKTKEDLYNTLFKLRGHQHDLISAITIAKNNDIIWRHNSRAHLTMRNFSAEFLGEYIAHNGDNLMTSVGGYQIESIGIHLFEEIKGDYFTILGFPLVPLLSFLREYGWIKQ